MPEIIGQYVDQIMTTELRPLGNMPRGVAHQLYEAVRRHTGKPLSTTMAQAIVNRVEPGDRVVILCGAGGPPSLPTGEIDGLLGAVAIARILSLGLGAEVHLASVERFMEPLAEVVRAGELNVRLGEDDHRPGTVTLHVSPQDDEAGREFSRAILDDLRPCLVLAIELLAPNRAGVIHGATGNPWHDVHFDSAALFERARAQGVLTCGIGDAGNEAGFGAIPEVAAIQPAGGTCRCPCGAGMAAAVTTDHVLTAAISDWGGYAVTALIAYLVERPDLIADADYVENLLRAAVRAGVVCGWHARPTLSDDGVPLDAQRAAATLIRTAVTQALTRAPSPSH
ncbi:glutamate cyclase domain-containing protein [Nonomuraea sp. NPDC048882]|uniref:glutamate cyclase domain-containing protein n=1 Tax=Nonomuraea sp. NPDC048882 TaxID=3154347 RepID=UPI0034101AD4